MKLMLNTICRGLVGHYSYMATTSSHTVYSEYLLYEPILRILQAKGYRAHCEYAVTEKHGSGDKQRIDFRVQKEADDSFGLEVKWAKKKTIDVGLDIEKLKIYNRELGTPGYIIVFGHHTYISRLKFSKDQSFIKSGKLVHWDSGKTNYAACWYQIV